MRTPPGSALSHHGVEDRKQLPHARHQSHLLGLTRLKEPLVELLDLGVVAAGDQRSHVERLPNPRPATPHRASTPQGARVAVEGSHTHQSRELSRRKRAEFGQLRQERPAQDRTHSRNAPEKSLVPFEGRALFDGLIEVTIRARKLLLEPPYVGLDASADGFGGCGSETVFLGRHHPNDLSPTGEDLLKLPGFWVGDRSGRGADGLGEAGEDEGVYPVGLGELTRGPGEVSGLAGIDHEEGNPGGGQGRNDRTLEASAGLQDHKGTCEFLTCELAEKLIDSLLIVSNDEVFFGGEDGDIQGGLGDVYPHVVGNSSANTQAGSPLDVRAERPNLAGAGSGAMAPAQATVRAPPRLMAGRGDPGFLAVCVLGPRSIRSTAPIPTDSRQKPKHKELWAQQEATFCGSVQQTETVKVPRTFMERLIDAVCYAA